MSPSVSDVAVVTVSWNGLSHLKELVPSLLPLGAGELIVVDNGSSDGTAEFLKRAHPEVRVLRNPDNRGFAHPNNLAAAETDCRYLALINNDMRADAGWLESGLSALGGQVACVASRILDWEGKSVDFNGSSLQYLGYATQLDIGRVVDDVTTRDRVLFPCGGAMVIDREIFQKVGGFDESYFAIFEDVDLGWRLWLAGYEVAMAPDSVVYHRGHATLETQASEKTRYLMHRNALMTILKNYEDHTVRQLFPVAVALAIRRAVAQSGARPESLYLWSDVDEALADSLSAMSRGLAESFTQLVAVSDVFDRLPEILEKRAAVQQIRQRSDEEVLNLFRDPLRVIVDEPEYRRSEARWLELLDLPSRLKPRAHSPTAREASDLAARIERLRLELDHLQLIGGRAAAHPPPQKLRRWRRLARRLRRSLGRLPGLSKNGLAP